jgi:hypothetical protein
MLSSLDRDLNDLFAFNQTSKKDYTKQTGNPRKDNVLIHSDHLLA